MSALPPKADMPIAVQNVRLVPKADMGALQKRLLGANRETSDHRKGRAPQRGD